MLVPWRVIFLGEIFRLFEGRSGNRFAEPVPLAKVELGNTSSTV